MARFFFHLYDDTETLDLEGLELPTFEDALAVAAHELRQVAIYELQRNGTVNTLHRIDVTDHKARVLESIFFDEVLDA